MVCMHKEINGLEAEHGGMVIVMPVSNRICYDGGWDDDKSL